MPPERRTVEVYRWNASASGEYAADSGLEQLAQFARGEATVGDIVGMVTRVEGGGPKIAAIVELMGHGNARQAAELVLALIASDPNIEPLLRARFSDQMIDAFQTSNLSDYPRSPEEYPSEHYEVVYIETE